jgi:octopamine receptor beta
MTKRKVAIMILNTWVSPALLSFVPIFAGTLSSLNIYMKELKINPNASRSTHSALFNSRSCTGWYTTPEHRNRRQTHPDECNFVVNQYYAVISSSISFWIPCTIMLFTYYAIFREANRQEKQLAMRHGNAMLMHRHSNCGPSNNGELSGSGSSKTLTLHEVESEHTPTKDKHLIKMKREHKAARTLGIIMGEDRNNFFARCFLCCVTDTHHFNEKPNVAKTPLDAVMHGNTLHSEMILRC